MLYDRGTKQEKELLPQFDRGVDEFTWSPDSQTVYFVAGHWGEAHLFSASVTTAKIASLTYLNYEGPNNQLGQPDFGEYGDPHVTSDGKTLLASRMTVRSPAEIWALELTKDWPVGYEPYEDKKEEQQAKKSGLAYQREHNSPLSVDLDLKTVRQITHMNDQLLSELDLAAMESFWFTGADKTRVQGFLIKPPTFDPNKKYPVKFLIHGGPQGAWGDSWSYRWNAELLAANGYVVIMINPRGSTGYGQALVDGVNGDWGGKPFIDLMRGLDYAEQHYNFIDKTRECALGASYGGYMADWILGHTDRFKCIVSHDGMFNPESAYGTTEELWFNEWEFKGTPWENRALYRKWSPMLAETNFKTPTLVVHSQLDYRLDVSEGYQLFTTLQRMKVPSKMLYFPDEGHWVLKPQNSQLWYKTVNDWVDQWTK
jgi:dipeptidyl aminopeptidase/acylaminoacyl peptidase